MSESELGRGDDFAGKMDRYIEKNSAPKSLASGEFSEKFWRVPCAMARGGGELGEAVLISDGGENAFVSIFDQILD